MRCRFKPECEHRFGVIKRQVIESHKVCDQPSGDLAQAAAATGIAAEGIAVINTRCAVGVKIHRRIVAPVVFLGENIGVIFRPGMGNPVGAYVEIDGIVAGVALGALGKACAKDCFAVVVSIDGRRAAADNPVVALVILPAGTDRHGSAVMVGVQSVGETALDGVVVEIGFVGIIDLNAGDPAGCAAGDQVVDDVGIIGAVAVDTAGAAGDLIAGDPGIGIAQVDAVAAVADGGIVDIRIAGLGIDAVIAVADSRVTDADIAGIGSDAVSAVTDIDITDGRTAVIGVNTDVSIINIRILDCAAAAGVAPDAAPGAGCGCRD